MAGRCWEKAAAPAEWGISRAAFSEALAVSLEHCFVQGEPRDTQIETYLDGLHASDLALALACRAGNGTAWEFFVAKYRAELYSAARAIAHGGAAGVNPEELADSLYADLYGMREGHRGRQSLFEYFHGRSKLSTWLRAVLAQRYVNEIRRMRKLQPMDDHENEHPRRAYALSEVSATSQQQDVPGSGREAYLVTLQGALRASLSGLDPCDRLRLAYYYADGRTLAEIGRLLGEHEATVSRKLDRTRRELHEKVRSDLRSRKKMSGAQVEECLEHARSEWPFDLIGCLRNSGWSKILELDRSKD
jgi:RNA polymerase sigma-70 factor (ECF subfamily)